MQTFSASELNDFLVDFNVDLPCLSFPDPWMEEEPEKREDFEKEINLPINPMSTAESTLPCLEDILYDWVSKIEERKEMECDDMEKVPTIQKVVDEANEKEDLVNECSVEIAMLSDLDHSDLTHLNPDSCEDSRRKILEVSRFLSIAENPWLWAEKDVEAWCNWVLKKFQLYSSSDDRRAVKTLHLQGFAFCQLTETDFLRLFRKSGKFLFPELEIWKNVHVIASTRPACASAIRSNPSQHPASRYEPRWNCSSLTSVTTKNQSATSQKTSQRLVPTSLTSTNQPSANLAPASQFPTTIITSTSQPLTSLNSSSSLITSDGSQSTESCHASLSKIPTFVLDSCLTDMVFADASKPTSWGLSDTAAAEAVEQLKCWDSSLVRLDADSGISLDSDCSSSHDSSHSKYDDVEVTSPDWPESWKPQDQQSKHLWQFLQELLFHPSRYQNCIRWLDRHQGIFKIEDSVRVAQLWGQRKNRPAMNYDKLSRSIRQYYKKGIIRKTSNSKRLVYQFCPKYICESLII